MKSLRDNLLVQFSVVSFVVLAAIAVVLTIVLSDKIRDDAIEDLVDEAVDSSSERLLTVLTPADLETPMTGERYDQFHQFVQDSIVSKRTARVKLWAKDGTVIYSNEPSQVGERFPEKTGLVTALTGEEFSEVSVPSDVDNPLERRLGTLMEVYTPIIFEGTTEPQGAFEIYQFYAPTAERIDSLRSWLFWSIGIGFVVLYGSLVSIVWGGSRTITRQRSRLETINTELVNTVEEVRATNQQLQEAQERLVRSERLAAIGELAAGVAHELRNPLGAIKNATYYLTERLRESDLARDNPRISQFLQIMDEEVETSNAIITDLMDFARVNLPSKSLTNLETVVEDALSRIEVKENVKVVKEFEQDLPEVSVDSEQLRRVFANLIKNADEAMSEGGDLTIAARGADGSVEIQFRDTGRGITEDDLPKVFEPLFTTKAKGIGLGLAIVREVVGRHGGTIEVASKLGEGTTFTIRLPLEKD